MYFSFFWLCVKSLRASQKFGRFGRRCWNGILSRTCSISSADRNVVKIDMDGPWWAQKNSQKNQICHGHNKWYLPRKASQKISPSASACLINSESLNPISYIQVRKMRQIKLHHKMAWYSFFGHLVKCITKNTHSEIKSHIINQTNFVAVNMVKNCS